MVCFVLMAEPFPEFVYMNFGVVVNDFDVMRYLVVGNKRSKLDLVLMDNAINSQSDIYSRLNINQAYPEAQSFSVVMGVDNNGKYLDMILPAVQYSTNDLTNIPLQISDHPAGIGSDNKFIQTISLEGFYFEVLSGQLKMYPHENGLHDLEFSNAKFLLFAEKMILYSHNSTNTVEFNHLFIHNGENQPFVFNGKILIEQTNETYTIQILDWGNSDLFITLGQMDFCGISLGQISIGKIHIENSTITFENNSRGINFITDIRMDIDNIKYTYNAIGDRNELTGIHIFQTNNDPPCPTCSTDPYDPTYSQTYPDEWIFSGGFQIGNIQSGPMLEFINGEYTRTTIYNSTEPASINLSQQTIELSLPIKGSIRVENAQIGGLELGPMMIDDIYLPNFKLSINGSTPIY